MTEHTRRTVLKAAGASTLAVAVAGCTGGDDDEGNGDENGDDADEFEIDPDTKIVLEGYASGWNGLEPEAIDGETNPTLVLEEGGEYTMEWVNGQSMAHDLQIWDDADEVVDELSTEEVGSEGEGATLEFTASSEMVTYVCSLHAGNQIGDLVVE
ncbi:twin-arginine translocation signal domain-containing protein [Haloterrigena sp. SYSU A558-1]|uniref:Twin-arginine translocation signal domain-containing protein n=1 Tax=Haloterrigena gelatinilytica TaxID=2741724 RepID=A0ABX2LB16_9EURY|nr:twin-arginine translocation signal domain-containing protein [Haloterrigena gelatinilytica]NUC72379.1 twin-arginine translocation signal domain-containing protein [Haloterrigena gelatinilytica]